MRLVRLIYYDMWAYYPPKESKTISPVLGVRATQARHKKPSPI